MYRYADPPMADTKQSKSSYFLPDAAPCANCSGDSLACVQGPNCVRPKF